MVMAILVYLPLHVDRVYIIATAINFQSDRIPPSKALETLASKESQPRVNFGSCESHHHSAACFRE